MVKHERSVDYFEMAKVDTVLWHVGPLFLAQKEKSAVEKDRVDRGLTWEDFYRRISNAERESIGWDRKTVGKDGSFEFSPKTLFLGQTTEDIFVPQDKIYILQRRFFSNRTGSELPLTTNLSAPIIHPGSSGYQTFEIINESLKPLALEIEDLICRVDIIPLDNPLMLNGRRKGQFANQQKGTIRIGRI